jgi:glyoxylase I family protein
MSATDSLLGGLLVESLRVASGRTMVHKAQAVATTTAILRPGPPVILGESHVQLRVRDLERSARFYTEIVGFREHARSEVQVIVSCGSWNMGLIASIHRASDPRKNEPPRAAYDVDHAGLQHLSFALGSAAEVDAAADWLDSRGVSRKPAADGHTPGSRFVTFYDPDGIPLEYYFWDAAYADVYGVADSTQAEAEVSPSDPA